MRGGGTGIAFPFSSPRPLEMPAEFGWLREKEPVARVTFPTGDRGWLVTRYDDVRTVLTDPRFSRAAATAPDAPRMRPLPADGKSMLGMDPPEHTRLRRLVSRAFAARRIAGMEQGIRDVAGDLVSRMRAAGSPADLVESLAMPLPLSVICQLLGIPYQDRTHFRYCADTMLSLAAAPEAIRAARIEMDGILADLIAARRATPGDDLLSLLITAREEGNALSEEELVAFGTTLLIAGYHTTSSMIVNGALVLLRDPSHYLALVQDPGLIPSATEEILRYSTAAVNGGTIRVATEDVMLGEVTIRKGEAVLPALVSANRDETMFADPDRFDPGRSDSLHLAFGAGVHFCLGAQLARIEVRVTLELLTREFPALHLIVEDEELVTTGSVIRSLTALPVAW